MKVLLLITDLERGGSPLRLVRLAHGLAGEGIQVAVGCLAPPGPLSAELQGAGLRTFACGARSVRDLGALLRLRREIRDLAPDLVHATLTHANVAARLVAARLGIPVIGSTATIEVERRWHRRLERCTLRWESAHLVNSAALAEHVVRTFGAAREHVFLIPPSIGQVPARIDRDAARRRFGIPPMAHVLLWVGRFDPVKRIDRIVECLRRDEERSLMALLAGAGPEKEHIAALAARLGVRDRVVLPGWQADLGPALSAADAFVFPSLTEGMPNALLAALGFGLPCVASDIPAHRELADRGARLRLVDCGDAAALLSAVRWMQAAPAEAEAMGLLSAAWAEQNLRPEATVQATIAAYERVLAAAK